MTSHGLRYPWFSTLGILLLLGYLYFYTQAELILFYNLPEIFFSANIALALLVSAFVLTIFDVRLFYRRVKKYDVKVSTLNAQVTELLVAKKQLQNKAHTFSGHADKLKLFISDRLLEYIEYDEKFLHFKSIAAEVRHTGVICFDKVQTALTEAIDSDKKNAECYQDALNSMIYLWDLLELSTTDNLALHISNQLCECEEQYYQILLNEDGRSLALESPTFSAQLAAMAALDPFMEKPMKAPVGDEGAAQSISKVDKVFWVELHAVDPLLGNANHVVLMLENLINNAIFFSGKKPYGHKYARVSVQMLNYQGNVRFSVYNHGPHILDEDKDQLFQLGYSTRKTREYNGKGLGLYFVEQIVRGYEGSISFENIENREEVYSIRIAFADGSIVTEVIESRIYGNKLKCMRTSDDNLLTKAEWTSKELVVSVEVSMQARQGTYVFTELDKQTSTFFDPEDTTMPRWVIEVIQRKRSAKVSFVPLDVNGVRFVVDLPTAEARLNYADSLEDTDALDEADLAMLREDFVDPKHLSLSS